MEKSILVVGFSLLLLTVVLSGCNESESQNDKDDTSDDETIKVKILDITPKTEDGSDENHYNAIRVVKIYNEGASGYATIHFDLYEGSFQEYSQVWEKEQVIHLDVGEYKEVTFVFEDMILGQTYAPEVWVEYD